MRHLSRLVEEGRHRIIEYMRYEGATVEAMRSFEEDNFGKFKLKEF